MELIQFDGRTCAVMAPEDVEEMESELTRLRAENEALRDLALWILKHKIIGYEDRLSYAPNGNCGINVAYSSPVGLPAHIGYVVPTFNSLSLSDPQG